MLGFGRSEFEAVAARAKAPWDSTVGWSRALAQRYDRWPLALLGNAVRGAEPDSHADAREAGLVALTQVVQVEPCAFRAKREIPGINAGQERRTGGFGG